MKPTDANIGSTKAPIPPGVFLEQINKRSIKVKKPVESIEVSTPGNNNTSATPAEDEPVLEQVYLVEPTGQENSWTICSTTNSRMIFQKRGKSCDAVGTSQ